NGGDEVGFRLRLVHVVPPYGCCVRLGWSWFAGIMPPSARASPSGEESGHALVARNRARSPGSVCRPADFLRGLWPACQRGSAAEALSGRGEIWGSAAVVVGDGEHAGRVDGGDARRLARDRGAHGVERRRDRVDRRRNPALV